MAVFIPRQEDLQEIWFKINPAKISAKVEGDKIDWLIFEYFLSWFMSNNEMCNLTINSIWLCFVMEKCYQKQWDDVKGEWVVI